MISIVAKLLCQVHECNNHVRRPTTGQWNRKKLRQDKEEGWDSENHDQLDSILLYKSP